MVAIHNVFAVIRGAEEPDRYVLLGNHRDAWTYGVVDPNSRTAALFEIARRYALLMHSGWIPRRMIILYSELTEIPLYFTEILTKLDV